MLFSTINGIIEMQMIKNLDRMCGLCIFIDYCQCFFKSNKIEELLLFPKFENFVGMHISVVHCWLLKKNIIISAITMEQYNNKII